MVSNWRRYQSILHFGYPEQDWLLIPLVNQGVGRYLKSNLIIYDISGQKNKMIYSSEFNLSSFINNIIKVFSKHHFKDLEEELKKIAKENHDFSSQEELARKDFIPNLEYSLDNIRGEMVTFADYISRLSAQVQ